MMPGASMSSGEDGKAAAAWQLILLLGFPPQHGKPNYDSVSTPGIALAAAGN